MKAKRNKKRIIFHIDVNNAFLSWEATRQLENNINIDIRKYPSVIANDHNSRKSIVTAKSIPAGKLGIKTGEPLFIAKSKCQDLIIFPPDFDLYSEKSHKLFSLISKYSPLIQRFSIDECFLDFTGLEEHLGDPIEFAYKLKDEIKNALGFTVNIGIGQCRLCAKMASDFEKPDKVHTLFKDEIEKKLWPLPVGDLFLVGKSTKAVLNKIGVFTIGDLANSDVNKIHKYLNKPGVTVHNFANGIDNSKVTPNEFLPIKSISNSTTLDKDMDNFEDIKEVLLALCDNVSYRLRKDHFYAKVFTVEIKDLNFKKTSIQEKVNNYTNISKEIYEICKTLFLNHWKGEKIRHLGVGASDLSSYSDRQINLTDINFEKQEKLDKAYDIIRDKYGYKGICRASAIETVKNTHLDKKDQLNINSNL